MTQSELDRLRHRAEAYLKEDPRVRRWRIRTDGAIALEIIVQGAVPPQDRFQIIEALGKPLYRTEREEGALDALLDDLVVVRVDVDGIQPEPHGDEPEERISALNHRFWVDVWVAYGFLNRGRIWKAIKHLADLREIIFSLGHLIHDPSRRDEEIIPEALRGALAQTCAGPDPQEIGRALLFMIFVFRRIRQDAEHQYKLSFNEETEQRLIEHLNEVFGAIGMA